MAHRIDTPTARAKLTPRRDPFWLKLDAGRYLGFRRGPDTWIAKRHVRPGSTAPYDYRSLGTQRSFSAAKAAAETWFATLEDGVATHYAIEALIADYVASRRLDKGGRSAHEAELLLASVKEKFKGREVSEITTGEFKRWRDALVPHDADEESKRRAKATANKYWSALRAALSLAYRDGKVARDDAWRRLAPFKDVGRAREFYPSAAEVQALIDHCADDFRPLVRAAVLTGFRLQALTGALVSDFDRKDGTLNIRRDKSHERVATLSSAAIALFKEQSRGKLPAASLFLRADGLSWGASHQHRPFRDACTKAKLPREFIFYSLRHFMISRALLAGVNVDALAKNVGTSATMISRHYGKWIKSDVRDMLDRVEVM
jgi:integrase